MDVEKGKNYKICRYINKLDSSVKKDKWSSLEIRRLF